jgi:hypothetical protein
MMMRFGLLAVLAITWAPASAAAQRQSQTVSVGGARYRVTSEDGVVTVAKKAFVVRFSIEERDAMRQAVKVATGCSIYDEIPNGAKLRGKLKC